MTTLEIDGIVYDDTLDIASFDYFKSTEVYLGMFEYKHFFICV